MVGDTVLDVVSGLNGIGQFLIIGAGILHTFEFGAVQSDALSDLINGLTPVFPGKVYIDVNAFTGIDEARHPAAPDSTGITVCPDEQETIVPAIHDDEVMVGQIQPSWGNKMRDRNMRNRVHANHSIFGCHSIHYDTVGSVRERFIHAGSAVEEHIQDLRRSHIRILGLQDIIPALKEIGSCSLLCGHQHRIDLRIVIRLISADGLILVNQKEAPGKRFSGSDVLDKPNVVLTQSLTLLVIFRGHFLSEHGNMLIRISLTGNALELKLHGRDLQPAGKGRKDIELLL